MKKIAFTSSGTALISEAGKTRKASETEVGNYLQSLVPSAKNGHKLAAVKYDGGFVFARYEDGKMFKKRIVAQNNASQQNEPLNSGDKSDPDLKVPRSDKHSKPENKSVTKDRPDVGNPTELRSKEYGKGGDKGADSHKGIPRSKSNSGLEGGSKTTFDKEKADDATSGKPDTYVQKLTKSPAPAAAGTKDNHATAGANTASNANGIQIESDSILYQKISIAEDEKKKEGKKDGKPVPPWLEKKEDKGSDKKDGKKDEKDGDDSEDDESSKKEAKLINELNTRLAEYEKTIKALKGETDKYKVREARQVSALKLALAYRDMNPEQFPTVDAVASKVVELCKQMNSDAIESTYEQVKAIIISSSKKNVVKTASASEGVSTAFSTPLESISDAQGNIPGLREALMEKTSLGRKVAAMDAYNNSKVDKD